MGDGFQRIGYEAVVVPLKEELLPCPGSIEPWKIKERNSY